MARTLGDLIARRMINVCLVAAVILVLVPQVWPRVEIVTGPLAILCAVIAVLIYLCGSRDVGAQERKALNTESAQDDKLHHSPGSSVEPVISHWSTHYAPHFKEHEIGAVLFSYLLANKSVHAKVPQTEKLRQLLEGPVDEGENEDDVEVTIGFVTIRLRGDDTELQVTPKKLGLSAIQSHKTEVLRDSRLGPLLH